MFDKSGERKPPCGVPFVGSPSPSISAFNSLDMIVINALSFILSDQICLSNLLWCTLSKKTLISTSMQ